MRWPLQVEVTWLWRRTSPGMVWIGDKELIELLGDALRTSELEAEIRLHRKASASYAAEVCVRGLPQLTDEERAVALAWATDPPLTAGGGLHEPAFTAAVDAAVWAVRDRERAQMTSVDGQGGAG
jgi:hypothetical protein